jgi:hypothetical protein
LQGIQEVHLKVLESWTQNKNWNFEKKTRKERDRERRGAVREIAMVEDEIYH